MIAWIVVLGAVMSQFKKWTFVYAGLVCCDDWMSTGTS